MVTAASGRRRRCRAPTTRAIEGARKSRIGQAGAPSKVDRPASPSRSTIRPPISSTGPQFAAAMRYLLNRIQRQPCLTPGFLARPDSRSPPYRGLAMSSNGASIQDISNTVGHKSTHVTETVYRHVIVPGVALRLVAADQSSAVVLASAEVCGSSSGSARSKTFWMHARIAILARLLRFSMLMAGGRGGSRS